MAYKSPPVLAHLLTEDNPLGPSRHERIIQRSYSQNGDGVDNWLIYQNQVFDKCIESSQPLIIGRRGSGKTAVATAFKSGGSSKEYFYSPTAKLKKPNNISVFIYSWKQLDVLAVNVTASVKKSPEWDGDWDDIRVETVANCWEKELWSEVFKEIYTISIDKSESRREFPNIISYIRGDDPENIDEFDDINPNQLSAQFSRCQQELLDYLRRNKIYCYIIVDSFEQYPVEKIKTRKSLGGLVKCINDFPDFFPRMQIKCCLPEEITPSLKKKSSNILKDYAESSIPLRWKPIDLMKIVADRYREFLGIYSENRALIEKIENLSFVDNEDIEHGYFRDQIHEFFDSVMPKTITNKLGVQEETIAYILRHTQLLPREFLLIFNKAIKNSYELSGKISWDYIHEQSIKAAIDDVEPDLIDQIISPYQSIYPDLIDELESVLPELNSIFFMDELDSVSARFSKKVKELTPDIRSTLFQIGIIGYSDGDNIDEITGVRYVYGRFHYNSNQVITFSKGRVYCVHPLFSGAWRMRKEGAADAFVYPAGVSVR